MNILTEKGLYQLSECRTMCEYRYAGNGDKHRSLEKASKLEYANGILFEVVNSVNDCFGENKNFFIGNLSNTKVKEILRTLNSEGYLDVSEWKFQSVPDNITPFNSVSYFKFDNGETLPYICDEYQAGCSGGFGIGMLGNRFPVGNMFPMNMPEEEEYAGDGEE